MYYLTLFEPTKEVIEGFLRMFECQRCGLCCTTSMGGIVVRHGDTVTLAKALTMDWKTFEQAHTVFREDERRLPVPCKFYENRGCSVYESRPQVCRQFPFNKSIEIKGKRFLTICGDCPAGKKLAQRFGIVPESVGVKV